MKNNGFSRAKCSITSMLHPNRIMNNTLSHLYDNNKTHAITCNSKPKLFNSTHLFMDYLKHIWRKLSIKYIYRFIVKITRIRIYMNTLLKEKFFSTVYIYKKQKVKLLSFLYYIIDFIWFAYRGNCFVDCILVH